MNMTLNIRDSQVKELGSLFLSIKLISYGMVIQFKLNLWPKETKETTRLLQMFMKYQVKIRDL